MDRRRRFFRDRFGFHHGRMISARTIVGVTLMIAAALPLFATEIPQEQRRSGFSFMGPDTKAMQNDDTANPGMLWVLDGEVLWKSKARAAAESCAPGPDESRATLKRVSAAPPALDKQLLRA